MTAPHSKYRRQVDKTKIHRQIRARDFRVQDALADARRTEAALDARMEREAAQLAQLLAEQAAAAERELTEAARVRARNRAARAAALRQTYDLGFARNLVREGYTVAHAAAFTGWPARMLQDVVPGQW